MSMCSESRSTRFGTADGAVARLAGAFALVALLLGAVPAHAFELGVGVGPIVDLPDFRTADCDGCFGWTPWPGGRLVVPMRLELSDYAALRLAPSFEVGFQRSRVSWEEGDYLPVNANEPVSVSKGEYYGHFGMGMLPKLEVGVEASGKLGKKGLRLTSSAGVSLGYMWVFQSVGENDSGNHGRSSDAYVQRDPDTHCNTEGLQVADDTRASLACQLDIVRGDFAPGVELAVGIRTAGDLPLFATLSYSSTGFGGEPNNYRTRPGAEKGQVTIPDGLWNPLTVTVGFWLGP